MKDKNYVDPKMAAYCQAMHDLEGKFHRLELIMCCATTTKPPTKTASSRKPVPHRVFAGDLHAPSVREDGEKTLEIEEPEVMVIDQPPELNLGDPD
jgi:hypothetical protein